MLNIKGHDNGPTFIIFDFESDCIVTGGSDGIINIWSESDGTKQLSHKASAPITSLAYESERVFVSSKSNKIEVFSTVTEVPGIIFSQFLSNVNYIYLNRSKNLAVAGSDDFSIKLFNLSENKSKLQRENVINLHKAPVMSVCINNKSTLIASASCDGFVCLINVSDLSIKNKFKVLDEKKDICLVDNLCRLKFSTCDSKLLAVPLNDKIDFYNCETGLILYSIKYPKSINGTVRECEFSRDGLNLLAGFTDGTLIIWNVDTRNVVYEWKNKNKVGFTDVKWHPLKENMVLYGDNSGNWGIKTVYLVAEDEENDELMDDQMNELFEGVKYDDVFDLEADEEKDIERDIDFESEKYKLQNNDTEIEDNDDEERESDVDINLTQIKKQFQLEDDNTNEPIINPQVAPQIVRVERQPHPTIRPGSAAKVQNMELLLWNPLVAMKKHFGSDNDDLEDFNVSNTIGGFLEVDFQDIGVSKNLIFRHNQVEYHLGDANTHALMLISADPQDDLENNDKSVFSSARIDMRPLNAKWTEWSRRLPPKEQPLCCCLLEDKFALVLSDTGKIRWLSSNAAGMEMFVECLPGHPVTLVSDGKSRIITVIDDGAGLRYRFQHVINVRYLWSNGNLSGLTTSLWHPLPISKDAQLTWIGFSDTGSIYSVDNKQQVNRLHFINSDKDRPTWMPVLDLKRAIPKEQRGIDRYFPIGAVDGSGDSTGNGMMCVQCAGTRTPRLVPLPHLVVVPFNTLMSGTEGDTMQLERALLQNRFIPDWLNNSQTLMVEENKLLFKLFTRAVLQNQESRAYGIAEMLPDTQMIQIWIKFAFQNHKKTLAQRLSQLALDKDAELQRQIVVDEEESDEKENESEVDIDDVELDGENEPGNEEDADDNIESLDTMMEIDNSHDINYGGSDDMVDNSESKKTSSMISSPFTVKNTKTVNASSLCRRGTDVIDKLGWKSTKRANDGSIKHQTSQPTLSFGNFNPSVLPHEKKFKLKRVNKRKSTKPLEGQDSPMSKFVKNSM